MARLAFDIDNTITDSTSTIKKYMLMHSNEYKDGYILIRDIDIILRGFFKDDVVKQFFVDYALKFADEIKIRENASRVINKLKEEGNEIYIITARSDEYYKNAKEYCEKYLLKNGIKFDKVITGQEFKIKCCKENNIDIMVDDGIDTCDDLNKNNIKALLYTSDLNNNKDSISQRVNSWNEVYEKIHEYLDQKK